MDNLPQIVVGVASVLAVILTTADLLRMKGMAFRYRRGVNCIALTFALFFGGIAISYTKFEFLLRGFLYLSVLSLSFALVSTYVEKLNWDRNQVLAALFLAVFIILSLEVFWVAKLLSLPYLQENFGP